jgi:hypothetical protein
MTDDQIKEAAKKDYPSIHYTHDVTVYIPCFQSMDAGYPSFTYSYGDATNDEQMAWSMKPDYVLTLTGKFDAKTQPYSKDVELYNSGR